MKSTLALSALVLAAAVTFLVAQQDPQSVGTSTDQPTNRTDQYVDPNMNQKFVKHSYLCNMFEIEAAKIAETKADRSDVKEFAKQMREAHTKANQELQTAAAAKGIVVPMELEAWQKAKLDHCRTLDAHEASGMYMFGQVGAHHMALLGNRCAANKLQDPELKRLALNMVTELRDHLKKAERISENIVAGREEVASSSLREGNMGK